MTNNNKKKHFKKSPPCEDCGGGGATFAPCPYREEIYGDDTEVWLCDSCREQNALDI